MERKENLKQELIGLIKQADMGLLQDVMQEISARYRTDYPDWEVIYLAIPRNDPGAREATFRWLVDHTLWEFPPKEN